MKPSKSFILLTLLYMTVVCVDVFWLRIDDRPPIWDMAVHLNTALDFSNAFRNFSFSWSWLKSILLLGKFYPTLFHALMGVFFLVFHVSTHVGPAANFIPLGILMGATYRIGQKLFSENVGRLSAFLVVTYPIMAWLAREALLDFTLAAMVAVTVWLYLKSENFSRTSVSLFLGLAFAGGFLSKHGFVFYVLPLALFALYEMRTRDESPLRARSIRFRNFLVAHGIGVAGAALWYVPHWADVREYYFVNRQLHFVLHQPEYLTAPSLLYTLDALTRVHLFLIPSLFLGGAIFITLRRCPRRSLILYCCGLGSLIIMTFATVHREVRMSVASLPLLAVLTAAGVFETASATLRKWMVVVLLLCGTVQFYLMTFGLRGLPETLTVFRSRGMEVHLFAQSYAGLVGPPQREDWKIEAALKVMAQDAATRNRPSPLLGVVPDLPRFNHFDFLLYARLQGISMEVQRITQTQEVENNPKLTYLLIKSGAQGEPGTTRDNEAVHRYLRDHPDRFLRLAVFSLPDQSQAELYRRT